MDRLKARCDFVPRPGDGSSADAGLPLRASAPACGLFANSSSGCIAWPKARKRAASIESLLAKMPQLPGQTAVLGWLAPRSRQPQHFAVLEPERVHSLRWLRKSPA